MLRVFVALSTFFVQAYTWQSLLGQDALDSESSPVVERFDFLTSPITLGIDRRSEPMSLKERMENFGRLYDNDDNAIMQQLWFLGRYHGQYHEANGETGNSEGWENRRFRIGGQAQFFDNLTLHAQMVSGRDMEPFYNGFTELWWRWRFQDELMISFGQQKHRFTHDRNVSSRYLNTLERGLLINMFAADYTPAVTISGEIDRLQYYSGVFSNATGRDMFEAFTNIDSGHSLLTAFTLDLGESFGADTAHWYGSHIYSDANENATNLNRFKDGLSSALILTKGHASLITELLTGLRSENGDAVGIDVQPGYFLTSKLQVVSRLQYVRSNDDQGLIPQSRYEQPAGVLAGDVYQSGYLGLNYYIAGHRIKLLNGIQYSNLSGQELWTASIAFRVFWGPHADGPFPTQGLL